MKKNNSYIKKIFYFIFFPILIVFFVRRFFFKMPNASASFSDYSKNYRLITKYNVFNDILKHENLPKNDKAGTLPVLSPCDFYKKYAEAVRFSLNNEGVSGYYIPYILSHAYLESGGGSSSLSYYNNFLGVKEYKDNSSYVARWTWERFPYNEYSDKKIIDYINLMKSKGFHDIDVYMAYKIGNDVFVYIKEPFKHNKTIELGFLHYIRLLKLKYPDAFSKKNPNDFALYLLERGYGTANKNQYLNSYVSIFNKIYDCI